MNEQLILNKWNLLGKDLKIKAEVPGDITIDMYNAGKVSNPYILENYKDSTWVGRENFTYECEFDVPSPSFAKESQVLVFEGIDLFSIIYLNGIKIGETKNAFLEYRFDVKNALKEKNNLLQVKMISTLNEADKINTDGYNVIFNKPRIFLRKPQCHFGWDWAPKICAYGIIGKVYLESKERFQIEDVHYKADDKGNLSFFIKTNYTTETLFRPDGSVAKQGESKKDDKLVFRLAKTPFGNDFDTYEIPLEGKKNFLALKYRDFALWWPTGYGEQPLYNYVIDLYRDNKKVDTKQGYFAFRSVSLLEEAKGNNLLGMDFLINNKKIFLKGSNWVPPEFFTGVMKDEKYKKMIALAKEMNINMLRVWGGGSYEKDIFYSLCDKYGILVWQDICLACADIPEDNQEFVSNLLKEVEYQVKRLRNHPCLVYWCGGNEKTGTYGNLINKGDFLVNCLLYGVIYNLDDTRPYSRQSPHSYTDVGNDYRSGDTHYGNFEYALDHGMADYRKYISKKNVPFVSECAVMGPSSEESLRKIFGNDHIWPMDEMWKDRFMENPYGISPLDFPHRELFYAEDMYGKVDGITSFVKKASLAHAEALRAEFEYTRANRHISGAFLNWMFDDIWPSGTWAILDYYLEPKQAYYALKNSYRPRLASFYEDKDGFTHVFFDNSTNIPYSGKLIFGAKKYDGKSLFEKEVKLENVLDDVFDLKLDFKVTDFDAYFFAKFLDDGEEIKTLYSPYMWRNHSFASDFDYNVEQIDSKHIKIHIKANSFAKSLFINFKDNYRYSFSSNYIDLEKGDEAIVDINSEEDIDLSSLNLTSF
ncbi:MAG TPA: hypothetical protein DEF61_00520 [Firmicutes bacterium]|nr:hypothetical protein [Bacillota bacterium]